MPATPESLGIKPPSNGFQEGGWYSGRQYIGGTLSDPGQIHTGSSQVGAGELVSKEVVDQSDPLKGQATGTDWEYIQRQRAEATPGSLSTPSFQPTGISGISGVTGAPGTSTGTGLPQLAPPTTIDLAGQYKSLYQSSGIEGLEADLAEKERAFTEAKGGVDDNPFLSEASRVGRQAKLQTLFDDRTKNTRDEIATKRADVETELNLQLKQFDINSQASKDALAQFNTLLSMGALDNASGEDIANFTRSTGISSNMIMNAIKAGTEDDVKTSMVTSTDNSGNVTVAVINSQTGEVIKKTSLGAVGGAKVTSGAGGGSPEVELKSAMVSGLESVKNTYGHITPQDWQGAMASWIARGGDADDFVANFKQYADPNRGDFDQVYYNRYE